MTTVFESPLLDTRLRSADIGVESYVDLKVDPVILADPLLLSRLKWTLGGVIPTDEVWERITDDYELTLASEAQSAFWTTERLNRVIAEYQKGGCWVHTVCRSTTRDMVVNVVITPELSREHERRFSGYHAAATLEALEPHGVFGVEIALEPIYEETVMRLFVPQIGRVGKLAELEGHIRNLMSSSLVLTNNT